MSTPTIWDSLLNLFKAPVFEPGVRVNRLSRGVMDRIDGHVLAQTPQGVLVEWPRKGCHWERPYELCQQG